MSSEIPTLAAQEGSRMRAHWSRIVVDLSANDVLPRPSGLRNLLTLRVLSVVLFRLSQILGRQVHPVLGSIVKQINHAVTGADIAWQAAVGPGLVLYHPTGVVIGPDCIIGLNARFQQGVTLGAGDGQFPGSPTVGNDVVLGAHSVVIGAIRVGDGCTIGANSVVTRPVPDGYIARGVPARSYERGSSVSKD